MRKSMILQTVILAALTATPALAQQPDAIANLSPQGRDAFNVYSQFSDPKAFAVGPDGAYGFFGGRGSAEEVTSAALQQCERVSSAGGCQVVSMNDEPMIAAGAGVAEALRSLDTTATAGLRDAAIQDYRQAASPKALATSGDGAWGWVAGTAGVDDAQSEALRFCNEWGSDCEVVETE